MKEHRNNKALLDPADRPGAEWVESMIQRMCVEDRLPSISTKWHTESQDLFVTLSIIAIDGKRVSKMFSRHELATCPDDAKMQQLLIERIAHLLRFLHPERKKGKAFNN
jgi:hypothetical protein